MRIPTFLVFVLKVILQVSNKLREHYTIDNISASTLLLQPIVSHNRVLVAHARPKLRSAGDFPPVQTLVGNR